MSKFKSSKKIIALILSLALITGMMPATAWNAFAAEGDSNTTYVLAGSDFQAKSGHDESAGYVSDILDKVRVDYPTMDGFLFAGDYDVNYSSSPTGHAKLKQTVQNVYGTKMHEVYVEGNHDSDQSQMASLVSPSGANDSEDYGVFVIHESDYMWHNDDEATIRNTASNLEKYLDAKRNAGYTKPIFVVSHLALNYSMRTNRDGDGKYAYHIYDVLDEAADAGLNIIYLFGHNHSNGWDDYLGGSSVFLKAGDKINICQGNQSTFTEKTLKFTYMNAGYVGYYTSNSSVDKTLTMSTFEITDNNVTINRYDANGKHNLKSQGYSNKNYDDSGLYAPNTSVLASPYVMTLNKNITGTGGEIIPPDNEDLPTVDTNGGDWVTINAPIAASTRYVYELDTDGVDSGSKYLIVANSYAKALSAAASSKNAVGIEIDGNYAYANSDTYGWTFTRYSNGVYYIRLNNSSYLTLSNNNALGSSNSTGSSRRWTVTSNNDGSYDIVRNNYNLRWSNSNGVFQASNSNEGPVRLYKYVRQEPVPAQAGLYGIIKGELTYNVSNGTSREDALAAVKAGIDGYTCEATTKPGTNQTGQIVDDSDLDLSWELSSSYDGVTPGEYAVTIKYNDVVLGVAEVVVPAVAISSYSVEPAYGVVYKESAQKTKTGSYIYAQLEDGNYYKIPVTVNMLTQPDGKHVSTGVEATYEGLTLTYKGQVLTNNYTLKVVLKDGNHYPEYPDEGAVKVNKTATGVDFQSSGIAKVELTASGVPVKRGSDVIIMLDTSSSMRDNKVRLENGQEMSRLDVMKASLENLVTQFQQSGEDGEPLDVRLAVGDFNQYYTEETSTYYINSKDHLKDGSIRTNTGDGNTIYTGNGTLSAAAFENVQNIESTRFDNISASSGTNYDYAFDAIYQLGSAILTDNANKGIERDLFVIFMSDGAPFQYNYFSAQSGSSSSQTAARYWNNWLQGTLTDEMKDSNASNDYYNEDGKHWMAEAIKGNPEEFYPVIRKNDPTDTDGDNWVDVQGLGATVYSIGFCLKKDKEITVDSMEYVLQSIASSSKGTYYRTDTYEGLNTVFTSIGSAITYAASEARFVDTMGYAFDLQMGNKPYLPKGETDESKKQTIVPTIEVKTYDIYTALDVNGNTVTEDMIGQRIGSSTSNEIVTFNPQGTEAYSSELQGQNILDANGVINAKTFWYNSSSTAQMIDTNEDGIADYKLAPETFYWNINTIKTQEVALSYYVYLTGSLEGTRAAGSYETNESAILYYTNYLGREECEKVTISPVLGWESANVSYAFYLVNEQGQVVVNQTTGETGSFANKIAVTSPVVYKEVMLNSTGTVEPMSVAASGVLPEGYEVYDGSAVYTVIANSNETGSWSIIKNDGKAQSTYVTNFGGSSQYSNKLIMDVGTNDYTHTVVWFAVVWRTRTIDDAVVIDYGLPVDINVLGNDMFGDHGKLNAVGAKIPSEISRALYLPESKYANTKQLETAYGNVAVKDNKVRYTPKHMSMDQKDTFAYEVNYMGTRNPGYYYGEVTVIPATTIYYEDSFVDFTTYTKSEDGEDFIKDDKSKWSLDGETKDATQNEDRPGTYHLPTVDANNLYGYDNAYTDVSTYSLGSAMKIDVTQNVRGEAEFDFIGTGFDIVGLTSNTTGTLIVQVVDKDNNVVRSSIVDTYYGYAYEDGKWITVDSDSPNALYQVPVMKIFGLTYGEYSVKLIAGYNEYFDHTSDTNGDYSLYVDAIRIYNPANDGAGDAVIKDAYTADKEYLPKYFEVRDKIVKKDTFNSLKNDSITGIVFIDGVGNTPEVADYESYGPNNEVYLQHGQAIAFDLDAALSGYKVESVQLGIKTVGGEGAVDVYGVQTDSKGNVTTTSCLNKTINTASDMYYNITSLDGKTVVIKNTGNDTSATISITNVKATYSKVENAQPTTEQGVFTLRRASVENAITTLSPAATEPDAPVVPDDPDTPVTPEEPETPVVPDTPVTPEEPDTPVVPEEPETPVVPETPTTPEEPEAAPAKVVSVKADKKTYTQGDQVKVTVTTNDEATKVKVGTKTLKTFKTVKGKKTWTTTVKASKVGKLSISATAYNKDGDASKKMTSTVTVKKFAPKTFKVTLDKSKVKKGAKYTVTVKTSSTVKYVKVNGKKITKFTTKKGIKTFKVTYKASKVGKKTMKVVAYNKAGYASKSKSKTVTIKKK